MRAQNNGACNALPCARHIVPRSASICGARRSIQPSVESLTSSRARALSLSVSVSFVPCLRRRLLSADVVR